ncbi:hypothetical protein ACOARS_12580, partial [Glaesserella parasuis]
MYQQSVVPQMGAQVNVLIFIVIIIGGLGSTGGALIGALLLWLSDQVILWLSRVWREVSTGSVTALIGAPLLLWLLPRLRSISAPVMNGGDNVQPERYHVQWFVLAGV